MNRSLRNRLLVIIAVMAASVYFTFPLEKRINLGLDLKGGMHLVLKVDTEKLAANAREDAVLIAIEKIRNRIDSMGVGETLIQRQGESELIVQLPGITDRESALAMIGTVGHLEFHLVNDSPQDLKSALEGTIPQGYLLKHTKDDNTPVLLEEKVSLTGETVADAQIDFDPMGAPYIRLKFNTQGSKQFGLLTQKNIGRQLAILYDGVVLSAPTIRDAIYGEGQITGTFTLKEASDLSRTLRFGSLPAPTHVEEERTIGPLLGNDSIKAGINASLIGGVLIFIFIILYYLRSGIIATAALAINLLMILGSMGFFNVMLPESQLTLTLPGIAGVILTLGMAIDANVLINERIREEIKNGRTIQSAISNGFSRALNAIIDSNVTTLIAAFMLFQFGSGPIKGFAVTLSLGILTSLFTAIFVTKTLFMLFLHFKFLEKLKMRNLFTNTSINFLKHRFFYLALSAIVVLAGLYTLIRKGNDAYGIDFTGGQIQEYKFTRPVDADQIRNILRSVGEGDILIQQIAAFPENVILRTAHKENYEKIKAALQKGFPDNPFETLRIERVGPVVGKALRKAAILAIVCALGVILVYVAFRFKHLDFAAAGVIALLHDVFITAGVTVMLGRQIDLLVVTALLTIAGYSINDTIVIYDRVRENLVNLKKVPLIDIINTSLNQTLSRTILTNSVTFLPVISLFLWGGEVLNTFALSLIIGFIAGTYSTIFIVSPLVIAWQKKK